MIARPDAVDLIREDSPVRLNRNRVGGCRKRRPQWSPRTTRLLELNYHWSPGRVPAQKVDRPPAFRGLLRHGRNLPTNQDVPWHTASGTTLSVGFKNRELQKRLFGRPNLAWPCLGNSQLVWRAAYQRHRAGGSGNDCAYASRSGSPRVLHRGSRQPTPPPKPSSSSSRCLDGPSGGADSGTRCPDASAPQPRYGRTWCLGGTSLLGGIDDPTEPRPSRARMHIREESQSIGALWQRVARRACAATRVQ